MKSLLIALFLVIPTLSAAAQCPAAEKQIQALSQASYSPGRRTASVGADV